MAPEIRTSQYWDSQKERGTPLMLLLLVNAARFLGRNCMQLVLWPVVVYFWLTGTHARHASRKFLGRALGRRPQAWGVLRHFYTFAQVSVDRVYLLGQRRNELEIAAPVSEEVQQVVNAAHGCLLVGAHFGSFEALRVKGMARCQSPIRIVLDRQVGRMAMRLLEELNPTLASQIIDASRRGPELVLDIKHALDAGNIVGIMADRVRADERSVNVQFLGGRARLPAGPWIVASALGVPVILGFGTYRGGGRYECQVEVFAKRVELPRATREEALQAYAQRYATRLEEQVRTAPYNWFNFYDYWPDENPGIDATAPH